MCGKCIINTHCVWLVSYILEIQNDYKVQVTIMKEQIGLNANIE